MKVYFVFICIFFPAIADMLSVNYKPLLMHQNRH